MSLLFCHFNTEKRSGSPFRVFLSVQAVDEASQILEPYIVGLLSSKQIDRFILIGDHKQLPAVVAQSDDDPRLHSCRQSLFERLLRQEQVAGRVDFTGILRHQGRMHPDIAAFPNEWFYASEQLQPVPLPMLLDISIDTVERYQGSQRDVIIYAFGVQDQADLDFLTRRGRTHHRPQTQCRYDACPQAIADDGQSPYSASEPHLRRAHLPLLHIGILILPSLFHITGFKPLCTGHLLDVRENELPSPYPHILDHIHSP